jgi:uncharacterized protein with FMN-binding domain
MKRNVLWLLSTLSVVVMLFGYHTSSVGSMAASTPTSIVSGSGSGSKASKAATTSAAASGGSGGSGSTSGTRTVTGSVVQTEWGPVQVRLTMKGGTITKVAVLQYPNGNPRDAEINSYALPILIQETKTQQSAQIDMVSGATVTSTGYLQSLQSALDQVQS